MAERIIAPDWLILRQAMHGSRVTPFWSYKYAHRKKSPIIMLSKHFKTLIDIYKIFDVLSSKCYGDHCRSLYINRFPFGRVLSPIDRYFAIWAESGIVCFWFHRRTSGLGNSNVCAAIVPFFSITFVSVCQLSPLCAIHVCTPTLALKFCRYLNH